ncbi:dienelactone hydrolase family protein [Sphingobium sp.]|uniref:carboxylesterase family protein n=1 Tax=Sphingobium sp. TaxID=1912891 RepID=UPI0028BE6093|nr:alpha/beta fold hydrolase [Sphingobium sp.]
MRQVLVKAAFAAVMMSCTAAAPNAPAVGDLHLQTHLAPAVDSAYRVYVPRSWKPGKRWPLVVILHGGGGDENSPFDRTPGFREKLEAAADAHGFILVSPRGLKGWWGARMLPPDATEAVGRGTYRMPPAGKITSPPPALQELSARDRAMSRKSIEAAIEAVQATYRTDEGRVFLMGNSMGSVGTLHLAQEQPKRWCAIAPSDGPVDPASYPFQRVKRLNAALFVHGDNDRVAPIESMRAMAEGFRQAGVPTEFLTVPDGGHSDTWHAALERIFDFFAGTACPRSKGHKD